MEDFFGLLKKYAELQPDKTAVVSGKNALSYRQLYERTLAFSNYLKESGLKKGGVVMFRTSPDAYYWPVQFGTVLAGGVFSPQEKSISFDLLSERAEMFGEVFLLVTEKDSDASVPGIRKTITCGDVAALPIFSDGKAEPVAPPDSTLSAVIFTTGTTGKSKGVCWEYSYVKSSPFTFNYLPYGLGTVMVVIAPLSHTLANGRGHTVLAKGGTLISVDGLSDLEEFYLTVEKYKANSFALTPSAITYLLSFSRDRFLDGRDRYVFFEIGGEKMPKTLQESFSKLIPGARMFVGYASTETGPVGLYEFSEYGPSECRVGKAGDMDLKFFGTDGKEVIPTKENPGFIGINSPCRIKGYFGAPGLTEKILKGSYVVLSDYGYIDDEGFLCLAGRAGDVIISGGYKINPAEVEDAAMSSGMISDCVCYGVKDEMFGKIAVMEIVPNDARFVKKDFGRYLLGRLDAAKMPKHIYLTDSVKRNSVGKTDRKYYREKGENGDGKTAGI